METVVIIKSIFSFFISFLLTFYLIPFFCAVAQRLNFLDVPDGKIKNHAKPIPHLGGLAIFIGFLVALALIFPFQNTLFLFFVGATLLLFVGLVDDFFVLKPSQKFFGQIIATLCFLKAGLYSKEHFFYNYWNIPISALWILTVINAFNLVDVMDGLASLLAIFSTLAFLVIGYHFNHASLVILLSAFLGPLLAFFWYNKPSATVYLGDAGSLFIGGFLATIPFLFSWGTFNSYGFLTPIIILAVPLLEVTCLILIRSYKKIPFYKGSPDHFSLYLQKKGWSKYQILMLISVIGIILNITAFLFVKNILPLAALIVSAGIFLLGWISLILPKRRPFR